MFLYILNTFEKMKDLILDQDFDLEIKNGDFSIKNSDNQNILLHAYTDAGQWAQYPSLGVGIGSEVNGIVTDVQKRKSELSESIKEDDYDFEEMFISKEGEIQIKIK